MYNREILNKCDNFINQHIIYPSKYPEGTSYIRRLLRLKSPLPHKELDKEIRKHIGKIDELVNSIQQDHPELQDSAIRIVVYERLALNFKQNLGYSKLEIDRLPALPSSLSFSFKALITPSRSLDNLEALSIFLYKPWNSLLALKVKIAKATLGQERNAVSNQVVTEVEKLKQNKEKLTKSNNLTEYELLCLELFDMQSSSKTNEEIIQGFLEYSFNNKDFNKRLTLALKSDKYRHIQEPINQLRTFSYKTSFYEEAANSINKLSQDNPKLTLSEYGSLEKIFSIKELGVVFEDFLNKKIKSDRNISLGEVEYKFDELQTKIAAQAQSQLTGLVIHSKKNSSFGILNKRSNSLFDSLINIFSPYSHSGFTLASTRLSDTSNNVKTPIITTSEMYESFTLGKLSKEDIADCCTIHDYHKVVPIKLISPEMRSKLRISMGITEEQLDKYLSDRLNIIVSNFSKNITDMQNPGYKQYISGLADVIPLGHKSFTSIRDWADKAFTLNPNKPFQVIGANNEGCICSEFVAKMTILSLVRLEQELKGALPEVDEKTEIIKLPFGKYESMEKIHPFRLIKEMMKAGALEKVDLKLDNYVVKDKQTEKHLEKSLQR